MVLARRTTRPGREMKAKRTILSGLLTHCLPNYSTAEFQVKGQHRCGRPPDRVGSELHEGNLPAAKPLLTTPCAHFALTAALPVPPDQLILRKVSVGHRATDPVPAHICQLHIRVPFQTSSACFVVDTGEGACLRTVIAVKWPGGISLAPKGCPVLVIPATDRPHANLGSLIARIGPEDISPRPALFL